MEIITYMKEQNTMSIGWLDFKIRRRVLGKKLGKAFKAAVKTKVKENRLRDTYHILWLANCQKIGMDR
jgi:hypothetical protein